MDTAAIARRFPLVPRPRPACPSLTERVREVSANALTAERDRDLAMAAAAQNKAALIASDCGMPELARTLCWRQTEVYLRAKPLDARTARFALEPLVNLARLHTRAGDGHIAYELLDSLFQTVSARSHATIDGREVDFRNLTATDEDLHALVKWLWTVLLADGTRALIAAGDWTRARSQAEHLRGVGRRVLDGRQVAILAHCFTDDLTTATTMVEGSHTEQPWEDVVTTCLKVLLTARGRQPVVPTATDMTNRYLSLTFATQTAVFHTRLGLVAADLAEHCGRHGAAAKAIDRVLHTAVLHSNGYVAREVLGHDGCRSRIAHRDHMFLEAAVRAAWLDRKAMPENIKAALLNAVKTSVEVTAWLTGTDESRPTAPQG